MVRDVRLYCGPPGAGKTTAAKASGLEVFDLDDPQWHGSEALFRRALVTMVARDPRAHAAVIRSGATEHARQQWASLIRATSVVILDLPADQCRARVIARARPRPPIEQQLAAITRWHATYTPPLTQSRPQSRQW